MAENDLIQPPENMELNLDDGTQVAGVTSKLRNIIKEGSDKTLKDIKEKPDASVKPFMENKPEKRLDSKQATKNTVLVPEAREEDVSAVTARINETAPTDEKPPTGVFNFSKILENPDNTQDITSIIKGFSDEFNIKTERVKFDQITDKAKELGIDERFIQRVVNKDNSLSGNATDVYRAMQLLESSAQELDVLMKKAATGEATEIDLLKLRQQVTLHGLIQKGVKGIQTNTARALAIMRVPRDTSNIDVIRKTLDETGGANSLQDLARSYVKISGNRAAQNDLMEKSIFSSLKDVWLSTWINGLLSSAPTHFKNIMGNTLFGAYQSPERLIAAVFSKSLPKGFRKSIYKEGDLRYDPVIEKEMIEFDEFLTDVYSMKESLLEGFTLAGRTWRTGNPSDPRTKIELKNNPDISADIKNIANRFNLDVADDRMLAKAIDLYGYAVQIPGRALLTQDEFFKGTFYRMAFNRLAMRRGKSVYRQAIDGGKAENEAVALAEQELKDIYENPPDDITEAAMEEARVNTFTNDLPPALASIEPMFQHPIVKTVVPFFRTPSNIAMAVLDRTPLAPVVSSKWRADFAAGGAKRDLALAKLTMGSSLLTVFSLLAQEGKMTGRGAERPQDREALLRSGWQPYSFVFDSKYKDLSPEAQKTFDMMKARGMANESDGKLYISYAGFEPLSAFLAIASDYADYARYNENSTKTNQVFMGAAFGLMEFMSNQPFLSGISDVADAFTGKYPGNNRAEAVLNAVSKQMTTALIGGSPFGFANSAVASIERVLDPTIADTNVKGLDLPVGVKGFYEAFSRYRSRIPFFSRTMQPRLNLWGEEIKSGDGKPFEMFLPTRVTRSQYSPVDDHLVSIGSPISMPSRIIQDVELTPKQYNQLIKYYNNPKPNGISTKARFLQLITDPGYARSTVFVKQTNIRDLHNAMMTAARALLIQNDAELQQKIQEMSDKKMEKGLFFRTR